MLLGFPLEKLSEAHRTMIDKANKKMTMTDDDGIYACFHYIKQIRLASLVGPMIDEKNSFFL